MTCSEYKNIHTRRGFTVLFAVLIASLVLTIGLSIFSISFKELILSSQIRDSQFAFYAADAGLECANYWDRNYTGNSAGSVFGGVPSGSTINNGLVGYWKLDESGFTNVPDSGSGGNDGTTNGGPVWMPSGGKVAGALDFDGIDDAVEINDSSIFDSLNEISVGVWFKTTVDTINMRLVSKDQVGVDGNFILWYRVGAGWEFIAYDSLASSWLRATYSSTAENDDAWHHIVGTLDSADQKLRVYMDGNEVAISSTIFTAATLDDSDGEELVIGADSDTVLHAHFFNGLIDEVRVYNRVLDQDEISLLALKSSSFINPIGPSQDLLCNNADITNPNGEWRQGIDAGWEQDLGTGAATTTFDLEFDNGYCAEVTVAKYGTSATIESRGYNTCDFDSPRRVERALRFTY